MGGIALCPPACDGAALTIASAKQPDPDFCSGVIKARGMLVAGSDRTINPDLERGYGKRGHSYTVEVADASHTVHVSHPKDVADVIESAARASK